MQPKKIKNLAKMSLLVMLTLSLFGLTSCAKDIVYVRGTSEALFLEEGSIVPYEGWLLQDEALIDLMEGCE